MNHEELKSFIKKIANAQTYEWDQVDWEKDESIEAYQAAEYLIYKGLLIDVSYLFKEEIVEELSPQEKYRLFYFLSGARRAAIISGQIRTFNSIVKDIKRSYFFAFKRAFKKPFFFYPLLGFIGIGFAMGIVGLTENPVYKASVVILLFMGWLSYFGAKHYELIVEQNEVITKKLYESQNQETIECFEKYFKKKNG